MGRENTIQWLASIEGDPEENDTQDPEEETEAPKEWNGNRISSKEDNQVTWEEVDPKQRSWKEAAIYFWLSQKGKELSMGSSVVMAVSLTMVGLAILLSDALTEDGEDLVKQAVIDEFFVTLYILSILVMAALMILGFFNKLTIDKGHNSHSNVFAHAGMTVLASGGIVYKGLVLASDAMNPGSCETGLGNANVIIGAIFIITQVAFLMTHSSTRINVSLPVTLLSRAMLMLVIATNLCIWFQTIITETMHEIHLHDEYGPHSEKVMTGEPSNDTGCTTNSDDLDNLTGPYLFPLLIEFCVVASTMILGVWEKCGLGLKLHEKINKAKRDRIVAFSGIELKDDEDDEALETRTQTGVTTSEGIESDIKNPHKSSIGFLGGWLVLLTSVVVVFVGLYNSYSSNGRQDILVRVTYASNLAFTLVAFAALPIAFKQMSVLTHKDGEIKAERHKYNRTETSAHVPQRKVNVARQLDKSLITVTLYALLIFKLLCMIAGYEKGDWVLFSDGLACIFMALLQGIFIAWFAFEKRTTKEDHLTTRPGRQALEFLRLCNLALWLINTFLLKNAKAKVALNEVFGHSAWVIISNIVQPMTILYYFHCTMCIAEIIHLCYTTKYVGIVRKSKQSSESPYNSTDDLQSIKSK